MARSKRTFNLDTRITDALDAAADQAGYASINQFVEAVLFWALKIMGRIPADAEPLPEMRGGKRKKMEQD